MNEYAFSWDHLGNIDYGRPNLGPNTRVSVYRLMQYTMREVIEKEYGSEVTREIFVKSGRIAGAEFCKNILDVSLPLTKFISQLHEKLLDYSIGVLKIEKFDLDTMNFVMTISEDLDCSGLPVSGYTVCDYDEGFIEGIFEVYTGKKFLVKEVDCWSTGDRTCRFAVNEIT